MTQRTESFLYGGRDVTERTFGRVPTEETSASVIFGGVPRLACLFILRTTDDFVLSFPVSYPCYLPSACTPSLTFSRALVSTLYIGFDSCSDLCTFPCPVPPAAMSLTSEQAAELMNAFHTATQRLHAQEQLLQAQGQQIQRLLESQHQQPPRAEEALVIHPPPSSSFRLPKPPKPSTFDGAILNLRGIGASIYIEELEQYMAAAQVPREHWVEAAVPYLKGGALLSYINEKKDNPAQVAQWDGFKAWFLKRFQPVAASKTARASLRNLRQRMGETLSSYNEKFLRLMQLILDMNEADKIEYYKNGLRDKQVYAWVDRDDPKSLQEAMEKAVLEDQRQRGNQFTATRFSSTTPASVFRPAPAAQQHVPMELGNMVSEWEEPISWEHSYVHVEANEDTDETNESKYDAEPETQMSQLAAVPRRPPFSSAPGTMKRLAKLTPEEKERCMKEGLCFRCRRAGHVSMRCPLSAKPMSQSGKGRAQ